MTIASAAVSGAWTGPIRSAQLNQYHHSPVMLSGAAKMSPHSAGSWGPSTNKDAGRLGGVLM